MEGNKMEILREELNKMVNDYDCNNDAVLELSKELDILIINFLKNKAQ